MSNNLTKQEKQQTYRTFIINLKQSGCPDRAIKLIRQAFWQTLTRSSKKAPDIYEQPTLFGSLYEKRTT